MHKTALEIIGKKTIRKRKTVQWWNEECGDAIWERNKAYTDLVNYKRAHTIVKKTFRAAKRKYWTEYCNNIGWDIQISDIWGMIRRMGGISMSYNIPILKNGEEIAISNEEKAEMLDKYLLNYIAVII